MLYHVLTTSLSVFASLLTLIRVVHRHVFSPVLCKTQFSMEPYPETRMLLPAPSKAIDAGIPSAVSMIDPFK